MKILPLLVAGSLAANAALIAIYVSRTHETAAASGSNSAKPEATAVAGNSSGVAASEAASKSGSSVGSEMNSAPAGSAWAALNTSDLRALADRLRAAGFPPSIVRAVIGSQISDLFKARRAALAPQMEDKPFWSTQNMFAPQMDQKFYAAMRELSREQGKMMRDVLGEENTADNPGLRRRYGDIPRSKIEQIQQIDMDYNDLRNEVNQAARGIMLPEDREKLAMLEKEKRNDLAQILSPSELDDYLMRTSRTTQQLRQTMGLFNASESEFRAIYAAQSAYDEKYNSNFGGPMTPDQARERDAAQKQTFDQIKAALGDQRYAEYLRASDREFQQLNRLAQGNVSSDALVQTYNLRDNASKESNRIAADTALSGEQKRTALQTLAQTTRAQITATLGPDVGSNYLKVANNWLSSIERGGAVTFSPTGNVSNIRFVGGNRPAPAPGAVTPAR